MKYTFFDKKLATALAYKNALNEIPETRFFVGHFGDIPDTFDAIVSPANSFGFMDGGIDLVYTQYFGIHVQENLQKQIADLPRKELLVGEALLVETNHQKFKNVIAAPTMRTPQRISYTANAFLAMRAVIQIAKVAGYETIAVPGLGTGVGKMDPDICARQVWAAILWENGLPKPPTTIAEHTKLEELIKQGMEK